MWVEKGRRREDATRNLNAVPACVSRTKSLNTIFSSSLSVLHNVTSINSHNGTSGHVVIYFFRSLTAACEKVHAESSTFAAGITKAQAYAQVLEQAVALMDGQRNWVCEG